MIGTATVIAIMLGFMWLAQRSVKWCADWRGPDE